MDSLGFTGGRRELGSTLWVLSNLPSWEEFSQKAGDNGVKLLARKRGKYRDLVKVGMEELEEAQERFVAAGRR